MRFEIPEVGRCCCCFPLRLGLIVWGYLKLTASLILLITILTNFIYNLSYHHYSKNILYTLSSIVSILRMGSLIADIVFHVIFAVGAHKKDPKKMELFLKLCMYILVMYVLGLCYEIFLIFFLRGRFVLFFGLTIGVLFFTLIIVQIYVMILVRSEVVKLKRGSNFQFINHTAEADMNVKIDLDEKTVY